MRKLAAVAELHHARLAPHGPSDVSPVGLAATLHFDLAIANLGVQEHMGHPSATAEVFRAAYREVEGGLHPGEAPGLGVDLDLAMAARHPYRRAYLPVARRRDGSVRSW
jgi:mannonate dehydratase